MRARQRLHGKTADLGVGSRHSAHSSVSSVFGRSAASNGQFHIPQLTTAEYSNRRTSGSVSLLLTLLALPLEYPYSSEESLTVSSLCSCSDPNSSSSIERLLSSILFSEAKREDFHNYMLT